jgi:hypothetical protein
MQMSFLSCEFDPGSGLETQLKVDLWRSSGSLLPLSPTLTLDGETIPPLQTVTNDSLSGMYQISLPLQEVTPLAYGLREYSSNSYPFSEYEYQIELEMNGFLISNVDVNPIVCGLGSNEVQSWQTPQVEQKNSNLNVTVTGAVTDDKSSQFFIFLFLLSFCYLIVGLAIQKRETEEKRSTILTLVSALGFPSMIVYALLSYPMAANIVTGLSIAGFVACMLILITANRWWNKMIRAYHFIWAPALIAFIAMPIVGTVFSQHLTPILISMTAIGIVDIITIFLLPPVKIRTATHRSRR